MSRLLAGLLGLMLAGQGVIRVDVQLQQLIVTVRDAEGNLVKNLKPEDFTLEEDGVRQPVAHVVQDSETPVSLGILVDTSASMAAKPSGTITGLRAAVGSGLLLMRLMKPGDEFLLMSFATDFEVNQGFTQDPAKIASALRNLKTAGGTELFPATERALKELQKARHRKRALIVITDAFTGGDIADLRRILRDSETLIYTFAIRGLATSPQYPVFVAPPGQRRGFGPAPQAFLPGDNSSLVLSTLANGSGGRSVIFQLHQEQLIDGMIGFVSDIAAELRGQYTLGYYPAAVTEAGRRIIRIRTTTPGHSVRFRMGTDEP